MKSFSVEVKTLSGRMLQTPIDNNYKEIDKIKKKNTNKLLLSRIFSTSSFPQTFNGIVNDLIVLLKSNVFCLKKKHFHAAFHIFVCLTFVSFGIAVHVCAYVFFISSEV